MGFGSTLIKSAVSVANKLKSEKASLIIDGENGGTLPVQFNPSEYKITEMTDFAEVARSASFFAISNSCIAAFNLP